MEQYVMNKRAESAALFSVAATLLLSAALAVLLTTTSVAQEAEPKEAPGAAPTCTEPGCKHHENAQPEAKPDPEDEHAGHDHGAHGDHDADGDEHAGHDHDADGDEHAGHDHGDHADEHAGHDHGAHDEDADEHAGHDHGVHDEDADEHAGHDHGAHDEDEDEHAGHDHAGHACDHDEGLTLSAEERRNAGVVIAKAGPGDLRSEISMPGEVSLNEDTVTHVVPLVSGITREARPTVGDRVARGDVLAVLDSSDLGKAKLDFLTQVNEILCCSILVPRAQAVHDNTRKLLAFLDGSPSLEDLREFKAGEAGKNLKTLNSAYAESVAARQTFVRERDLYGKEIASEQDYLAAKTQYEKAVADYMASRDDIAFDIKHELFEAEARLRAAKFAARTSEQQLRLMGVTDSEIEALEALVLPEKKCTDPNCKGCKTGASEAEKESYFDNHFARYEARSPAAGVVVAKHIVRGERVDENTDIFTIADISTVWVNLTVYLKDLHAVRVGQEVTVRAEHSGREARGRIAMVSPVVDPETRTATARLVLENDNGNWRPGVFVTGRISVAAEQVPVVIPKNAVQTIDGEHVVFVPDGDAFTPVPVTMGRSDRRQVEITAGLAAGTSYVTAGAFELKAKLVTSNLDPHAGHGH